LLVNGPTRADPSLGEVLAEIRRLVVRMAEDNPTWGSYEALGVKAPSFRRGICTPSPLPLKRTPREQDPSASVVVTLPIAPAR